MLIAIEGMDGCGKTTTARLLADKLGCGFVEKPLHLLLGDGPDCRSYLRISEEVNGSGSPDLRAVFYGLGCMYLREKYRGRDVVTDRFLASDYLWNSSAQDEAFFDFLVSGGFAPDFTVLLYADASVLRSRIVSRGETGRDLAKIDRYPHAYEKMEGFLRSRRLPFALLDNTRLDPEQTAEEALRLLRASGAR
jgi:thymidylate kinase